MVHSLIDFVWVCDTPIEFNPHGIPLISKRSESCRDNQIQFVFKRHSNEFYLCAVKKLCKKIYKIYRCWTK